MKDSRVLAKGLIGGYCSRKRPGRPSLAPPRRFHSDHFPVRKEKKEQVYLLLPTQKAAPRHKLVLQHVPCSFATMAKMTATCAITRTIASDVVVHNLHMYKINAYTHAHRAHINHITYLFAIALCHTHKTVT